MCLAVPGKIEQIEGCDPLTRRGRVNFSGVIKQVNLAYTPEARIGDYVLVHVGFSISVIDEAHAKSVFEYLRQVDSHEFTSWEAQRQRRVEGEAPSGFAGGGGDASPYDRKET